jgi:hypothetical protein
MKKILLKCVDLVPYLIMLTLAVWIINNWMTPRCEVSKDLNGKYNIIIFNPN